VNTTEEVTTAASDFALDTQRQTLGSYFNNYILRLRGGDLGVLPAMLSIIVLGALFGYATRNKTGKFLTLFNGANFVQQASAVIMISVGVTFVLIIGEIDLAAGWTAGVGAAVLVTSLRDGRPLPVALLLSVGAAAILGFFTGFMVAKVGIPSFVVTLANFLIFQGVLLLITGEGGTVQLNNKIVKGLMNENMGIAGSWLLAGLLLLAFAWSQFRRYRRDPSAFPLNVAALKIFFVAIPLVGITFIFARDRRLSDNGKSLIGFPWVVPLVVVVVALLTLLLTRTGYGRHLYAVGGNAEAARRAGINVVRIKMVAFIICAVVSGIGGWLLAAQRASVDPQLGGNETLLLAVGAAVIGGTSLFGGRGKPLNSVLGGIVLAMIPNALPLIGKAVPFGLIHIDFSKSGIKYISSGLILFLAASLDALSRKRASV
jgi:D-xylose transport system permease protein